MSSKGILWAVPTRCPTVLDRIKPIHPVETYKHITLQYGVDANEWIDWSDYQFWAQITGSYANERIQALTVDIPDSVPFGLTIPHITISRVFEAPPVESTEMIQTSEIIESLSEWVPMKIEFMFWD